jgi:hypothetical protein
MNTLLIYSYGEKRYVLYLYEIQKKFSEPGEAAKQLLSLFIEKNCFSTYQCYKELNKQKKISYKNVHKRVKKLIEFGMLNEVSNNGPQCPSYDMIFYFIYFPSGYRWVHKLSPFQLQSRHC